MLHVDKLVISQFIHYTEEQMSRGSTRHFAPVQLGSIELFCKAADLGSFTAAAEALGLTPAAVSRSVGRLEARLGARLFVRTTRSIRLTEDGALYKAQCQQALEQIAEAERAIAGHQSEPSGLLGVSVGTVYANFRLVPLLPAFRAAYPRVELDLHVSNRNIDFVEDGYDLAIRLGEPRDSRLIARRLEDASVGVFAAPDYLARRGTPATPQDLPGHDLLLFVRPSTGRPMPWLFRDPATKEDLDLPLASPLRVHEDVQAGLTWAQHGGGLIQTYHFAAAGTPLVEVLQPWSGRSRPFYALYPHHRHLSARVRAFVDFLAAQLSTVTPAGGGAPRPPGRSASPGDR